MSVRLIALSGWMDRAGTTVTGWWGSPITRQTRRTVWRCCHVVGDKLLFKAHTFMFYPIWILNTVPLCFLCAACLPFRKWKVQWLHMLGTTGFHLLLHCKRKSNVKKKKNSNNPAAERSQKKHWTITENICLIKIL